MKVFAIVWAALSVLAVQAADPVVGDSRARVIDELGEPRGSFIAGRKEQLEYERGTIDLLNGVVSSVRLVTAAAVDQQKRAVTQQNALQAEANAQRLAEGKAERDRLLADPALAKKKPAERVELWKSLAARYPGLDVATPLQSAQDALAAEQREKEAAIKAAQEARQKAEAAKPKLSSSKKRKLHRGDTNEVDNSSTTIITP